MPRIMKRLLLALALPLLLAACATNPYTGRSQLLLLSDSEETQMGVQAWSDVTSQEPISTDPAVNAPLLRVGAAISARADELLKEQGDKPFAWEFKVITSDMVNAWCLPGGKIAFYTGIFPIIEDEAGMAVVMGHEVCHALLHHGNERVSQNLLAQLGLTAGSLLTKDSPYKDETMAALGAGVNVGVLLPFSRSHESEADRLGLMLAADAGYDPEAAIRVWQNMAAMSDGERPPEILSTHPDPLRRIENMRQWMPEAKRRFAASNKKPNGRLPGAKGGGNDSVPPALK
jgi:predicted Zn-dependent protease